MNAFEKLFTPEDRLREVLHSLRGHPDLQTTAARKRVVLSVCRQAGVSYDAKYLRLLRGKPRKKPFALVGKVLRQALSQAPSTSASVIDLATAKQRRSRNSVHQGDRK